MDDRELRRISDAMSELLRPHLERSESLRDAVRLIGRWLIEEADQHGGAGAGAEAGADAGPSIRERTSDAAVEQAQKVTVMGAEGSARLTTGIVRLNIGGATTHLPVMGTTEELGKARQTVELKPRPEETSQAEGADGPNAEVRLPLVVNRCRLKAASCRLFAERRAVEPGTEDEQRVLARMKQMLAEGKALESCFLWALFPDRPKPDDATLEQIARCYEAHAAAAALCQRIDELHGEESCEERAEAFALLAEANSGLRVAMRSSWLRDDDRDQADVHAWLRRQTALRRIFIARHMTVDDPADPNGSAELLARLGELSQQVESQAGRLKEVTTTLKKLAYHAGLIVKNGHDESEGDRKKIAECVAHLRGLGVATSDGRIARAIGARAADGWPEEGIDAALREVLARAATKGDRERDRAAVAEAEPERWSEDVLRVRAWLRGRRVVVIGGEQKRSALERMASAFDLSEAEWVELAEHGPGGSMRGPIGRADTALVVVIIKLTGHLHAEEARACAAEFGKACVYLTGGYNPEQVAHAVLEQASVQLGAMAGAASQR